VQQLPKILLLCLAVSASLLGQPVKRSDPVRVRYVVDGDTIDVAGIGRVRLVGIDAPEVGRGFDTSEPFAHEAQQRLLSLVVGRWVRLEYEQEQQDSYQRRLAYVFIETGTFVNALMVREGLARVSARKPLARLAELQRAEAEAKSSRRGMWGARPSLPPERYVLPRKRTRNGNPGPRPPIRKRPQ